MNQNIHFEVKLRAGFLKLGTVSFRNSNFHACRVHFTTTKFSTILLDGSSKEKKVSDAEGFCLGNSDLLKVPKVGVRLRGFV